MKRFTLMVDRMKYLVSVMPLLLVTFIMLGCDSNEQSAPETGFHAIPQLIGEHQFTEGDEILIPTRMQIYYDTLFVAFKDQPFIDMYTTDFKRLGRIGLVDPETVVPTEFYVTESMLVVISHSRGMVILYDRSGALITSFGTQPDGVTPLMPYSVFCYGGVAYISDISLKGIMAVSLTDAKDITEVGELILVIPSDTTYRIGFPSALIVTIDGRLISADANDGKVKVYTCDGRYVYDFDSLTTPKIPMIHGFAYDDVSDPSLIDTTVFDPSNIHTHGRIHTLDPNNRQVHMFSTLGKYVASYPNDSEVFERPSDIVIDFLGNQVFVADPVQEKLLIFGYQE